LTVNTVNDHQSDWSPADGHGASKIAWASQKTGYEIWTMDPDGQHKVKLTEGPRQTDGPDWSPDSSRIAFYSNRDADLDNDVYVMNADGTNQTNLTAASDPNSRQDWSPSWSADGARIIFGSTRVSSPNYDVYSMAADGSDPINVTRGVGNNSTPTWHSARGLPVGFVARNGTNVTLNGRPYRFTGLNIYNANSDGWCSYPMDAPVLEQSLDSIGSGKNVIRAWFFQPLATTKGAVRKRDWSRFDHTLEAAAAHGMRVIATLTDEWGECGSDQSNPVKDSTWYQTGYTTVEPGNTVSYRNWVHEVVSRYKDDPRVALWQLINEAEYRLKLPDGTFAACPQGTDEPANVLKAWATDVSGLVKSIDPNHLVSLGSIGGGQCGMQGPQYKDVHDIPTIDMCEYHDYGDPTTPLPGDQYNGFIVRVQQCNELNKPLFVGEVGIIPDQAGGLQQRADDFAAKKGAMFGQGVVGFLAWAWSKNGSTSDNYDIGPGDPALDALDLP